MLEPHSKIVIIIINQEKRADNGDINNIRVQRSNPHGLVA